MNKYKEVMHLLLDFKTLSLKEFFLTIPKKVLTNKKIFKILIKKLQTYRFLLLQHWHPYLYLISLYYYQKYKNFALEIFSLKNKLQNNI
jgi:hypothetical protein